ncbi:MAG: elongation factor 1-beta [Euryarchaeota archaeon]|nr:elongation factor 1-beta [Euryarchaeota archaeon]
MGEVALTYRLLPENAETDIEVLVDRVKGALPEDAKWNAHEIKPFAFGLKAIQCQIIVSDEEGGPDKVTEILQGVADVQGVELLDMGRLL